jgi:quercetin dioxygenase-like cupin family protein
MVVPPVQPVLSFSRASDATSWAVGRAGMRYRDLMPERQGGRFVASVIHVEQGGPLPDYAHYHKIRFQMIFCLTGVATLVYEDQGPPFQFRAGDCVLQPPEIRHRVLDATAGFEVVELGCPAEHTTRGDPQMTLPTADHRPDRVFGGQRFVRHDAGAAPWAAWRHPGFERQDFGFVAATAGLAEAGVVRAAGSPAMAPSRHDGELQFWFLTAGRARLSLAGQEDIDLAVHDSIAIPPGQIHQLHDVSSDCRFLEVRL